MASAPFRPISPMWTSGGTNNNNLTISAVKAGAAFNSTSVDFIQTAAAGSETALYNASTNTLNIYSNAASTTNQVIAAVNATGVFAAKTSGAGLGTYAAGTTSSVTSGGTNGNQFTLSARAGGASFNNVTVVIADTAAQGSETASFSAVTNTLTINANAASTTKQVVAAVNNATSEANGAFSATTIGSGHRHLFGRHQRPMSPRVVPPARRPSAACKSTRPISVRPLPCRSTSRFKSRRPLVS